MTNKRQIIVEAVRDLSCSAPEAMRRARKILFTWVEEEEVDFVEFDELLSVLITQADIRHRYS